MMDITPTQKRNRSQWTSQFLAAAELCRRHYTVSFTMGNCTPEADLMVRTRAGTMFAVDVKGQSSKAAWLVSAKPNLFYVFVLVANPTESAGHADRFFVLRSEDVAQLHQDYLASHPGDQNKVSGFAFSYAEKFENAWSVLPPH